jgi:hypothetical protein
MRDLAHYIGLLLPRLPVEPSPVMGLLIRVLHSGANIPVTPYNCKRPLAKRISLEADWTLVRSAYSTRRCSWTVDAESAEMGLVCLLEESINISIVQM